MRYFRATYNREPMGAHVLRRDVNEIVVRVMYFTDHIPPDRAWFVVSDHQGAVREISLAEAADTAAWR